MAKHCTSTRTLAWFAVDERGPAKHPHIGGEDAGPQRGPCLSTGTPPHQRGGIPAPEVRRHVPAERLPGETAMGLGSAQEQGATGPHCGRVRLHADDDHDDGHDQHPRCGNCPRNRHGVLHGSPRCRTDQRAVAGAEFYRSAAALRKLISSPHPCLSTFMKWAQTPPSGALLVVRLLRQAPIVSGACLNAVATPKRPVGGLCRACVVKIRFLKGGFHDSGVRSKG